ncbi:MAG: hypothetical protein GY842_01435 [bacterium]|nr:hypothetical protein [bacterium]
MYTPKLIENGPVRSARAFFCVLLPGVYVAGLLSGCQQPTTPVSLAESPFHAETTPEYCLYPGDELYVRFPTNADLDQPVRIRSDGMISLPHIGDIQAAQRSPMALASEVESKLVGILQKPEVAVMVTAEAGRLVYVGGEVLRPGAVSLRPQQTLAQVIFEAGGALDTAHLGDILILRHRIGEATYVLKSDLALILAGQAADVRLEPCDIVFVPETIIAKIDEFVEQYINRIIPRPVSFPFTTELAAQPVRIVSGGSTVPPVTIAR